MPVLQAIAYTTLLGRNGVWSRSGFASLRQEVLGGKCLRSMSKDVFMFHLTPRGCRAG